MKIHSKSKIICFILVNMSLLCSFGHAQPMSNWPVEVRFEVENVFLVDNSLQFSIGFTPNYPQCDIIEVTIESFNGLTYLGDTYWTVSIDDMESYSNSIDIILPSNSTSRIEISINCDNRNYTIVRKFIVNTDTLKIIKGLYDSNQFGIVELQYEENVEFFTLNENIKNDSLSYEAVDKYFDAIIQTPLYDGPLSKFMTIEERKNYDRLSPLELELIYMRSFETEPLKGKEREYYFIKDLLFMRTRGEFKFIQINGLKEENRYYQNLLDSLLHAPQDGEYDVTIVLTDSKDYDFVNSIVEVLVPTRSSNLYRAIISDETAEKLKTKKIKFKNSKPSVQKKRKKD